MQQIAQKIEQLLAKLDVFTRGVEVQQEVPAAHQRIQIKARDVFLDLLLLDLRTFPCELGLQVHRPLGLEGVRVHGDLGFVGGRRLVAVEESGESAFFLLLFASFGDEDDLSPEIDEAVLVLGRVEEDEVQVHTVTQINNIKQITLYSIGRSFCQPAIEKSSATTHRSRSSSRTLCCA